MHTLRVAFWLLLYGGVRALDRAAGTRRRLALSAALLVGALSVYGGARGCAPAPMRVATYNIRRFGVEPTDLARLGEILRGVDADVVAVQEIQSEARLDELVRALGQRGPRRYAYRLADCGGKSQMRVGFLYDTRRVTLRATREYAELDPGGAGRCTEGERAGLLGVFDDGARSVHLLVVHLAARADPEHAAKRRAQWARALAIVARLRAEGAASVALLGDVNSTGYLDNAHDEQDFIQENAARAGLEVATHPLACSEYWRPAAGRLEPSLLDHVVATPGLALPGTVRVHGYCAALACAPQSSPEEPEDYRRVSDHCPVSFEAR